MDLKEPPGVIDLTTGRENDEILNQYPLSILVALTNQQASGLSNSMS